MVKMPSQSTIAFVLIVVIIAATAGLVGWYVSSEPSSEGPNYEAIATLTRVDDGDTVEVSITEILDPHQGVYEGHDTVRFAGIDTEETELNAHARYIHPELERMTELEYEGTDYYQHAISAKELVENLCSGRTIYLDIDDRAKGRGPYYNPYRGNYNRLIAVLYVKENGNWINVNAEVLRQEYPGYCSITWFTSEFDPHDWLEEGYPYVLV